MKSFSELPSYKDLHKLWKQEPVDEPVPDLELTEDSWVERGAEVIGWQLCRLEYWLSKSGWLRAWFRLNLLLSIVLTITGILLLPPVSQVLKLLAESSHWVSEIALDVVAIVSGVPPIIISIGVVYLAIVIFRRIRASRKRRVQGGLSHGDGYYE